jgi:hypothetical protein
MITRLIQGLVSEFGSFLLFIWLYLLLLSLYWHFAVRHLIYSPTGFHINEMFIDHGNGSTNIPIRRHDPYHVLQRWALQVSEHVSESGRLVTHAYHLLGRQIPCPVRLPCLVHPLVNYAQGDYRDQPCNREAQFETVPEVVDGRILSPVEVASECFLTPS